MSHRHRLHIALVASLSIGGLSAMAFAQSEEPKGSAKPGPAAAASAATLKPGEVRIAPLPQPMPRPPLSAEEKALVAIEEEGRQQVLELMKSIEAMPDGLARRAMLKKAVQLKQDNYLKLLRTKVDFARTRGDFAAVRQGEAIITAILTPRPVLSPTVARPLPEKSVVKEGGQK
jgi:hypothetical protein